MTGETEEDVLGGRRGRGPGYAKMRRPQRLPSLAAEPGFPPASLGNPGVSSIVGLVAEEDGLLLRRVSYVPSSSARRSRKQFESSQILAKSLSFSEAKPLVK